MNPNGLQRRRGQRCGARDAARPGAAGSVPTSMDAWAGTKVVWVQSVGEGRGGERGSRRHCAIQQTGALGLGFTRVSEGRDEEAGEQPCCSAPGLRRERTKAWGRKDLLAKAFCCHWATCPRVPRLWLFTHRHRRGCLALTLLPPSLAVCAWAGLG